MQNIRETENFFIPLHTIHFGIVCPMANESQTAKSFVKEVLTICKDFNFHKISFIIIVDKVSTDSTLDILYKLSKSYKELKVIYAPENKSVVDAYLKGYLEALKNNCDWILEIDGGFSHLPKEIPNFINKMMENYDCVFGSRFCKGGQFINTSFKRFLVSKIGTILTNFLLNTKLSDMTSGFEIFTNKSLSYVIKKGIKSKGPFFQTEVKIHAHNLHITEIPISYRSGSHNINKNTLVDALKTLVHYFKMKEIIYE
jgi:dolichol-phosphate mannosyltransferase